MIDPVQVQSRRVHMYDQLPPGRKVRGSNLLDVQRVKGVD